MITGLNLLESNSECRRAFALMNEAMLNQQIHSKKKLRKWNQDMDGNLHLENHQEEILNDSNLEIEFNDDISEKSKGQWRAFQIAFILMNLNSFIDPHSRDRLIADLIWFPTGGGKTEAYLGLSAFVIFLRRIQNGH